MNPMKRGSYTRQFPMQQQQTYTTGGNALLAVASQDADVYTRMSDPLAAVKQLGEMIATSGLFGCTKVEQGQVLALQCLAERKPPLELAKTYHLIEGKLSMRSDAMLAKFQMSGGRVEWQVRTDKEVTAVFSHNGNKLPFSVRLEDFVANGVATSRDGKLKDNWRKFPRQMLTARVISEAVRLLAPEIVFGVYTPEEVQDFSSAPEVKTVKPEVVKPEPAKLDSIITPELEADANAFLIARTYIQVGQTYRDVGPDMADRIIANPRAFIEAVQARASA